MSSDRLRKRRRRSYRDRRDNHGETPLDEELLLRNGAMQSAWWRNYRLKNHVGLSPFAARGYDDAVHVNRRAPFGIVEVQVMTADLHRRVHCEPGREESHEG